MKRKFAFAAALAACLALAGCGATADTQGPAATDAPEAAQPAEDSQDAADPYAYLAAFDFSAPYDGNGYLADLTAGDYVTLAEDYADLSLTADSELVEESSVDEYIFQQFLVNYQDTERPAEMGDLANIDYVGSVDGEEFAGGSAQGYSLQLGSGSFIDDFEEQIAGHVPGETFDVTVTFPDPYTNNPDLAGKEALFKTTLNYVNPKLTDAFVAENLQQSLGFSTAAELREHITKQLRYQQQANVLYSQLVEKATYADPLPASLLEHLRDEALYSPYQACQIYGVDMDTLVASQGYGSVDEYLAAIENGLQNRAKHILLMQAVAEQRGIVCDSDLLHKEFDQHYLGQSLDDYAYLGENYLKNSLLADLVMDSLLADAAPAQE